VDWTALCRSDDALRDVGGFFRADRTYVFLFNKDESTMTCTHEWAAEGIQSFKGITIPTDTVPYWTQTIFSRRDVKVTSPEDIPPEAVAERRIWVERGVRTLVAVPMSQESRVLGLIGIESVREARPWPEETVNMLYLLGNVFASAMARRDAQRKLEAARAREVEIGSRIQQTLLLSPPPSASADFETAALTIPSRGIDGDFYDFLLHPNRSLDVIFGDVMGKGVPAALLSAGAKTEFLRSLSHLLVSSSRGTIPEPEDIVNSVHSVLTPQLMNLDSFVTLSYARLNPQMKQVAVVDCGNTRLLRCGWYGGPVESLSGFNLPLGFTPSEVYQQAEYDYQSGDLFLFYSDGVTEARSPDGELFGLNRVCTLVDERRHMSPQLIVEAIREAVTGFVGSSVLADDLTCVP
jgi:serine phosphatase RsbU (regulator of sigma subunit)